MCCVPDECEALQVLPTVADWKHIQVPRNDMSLES